MLSTATTRLLVVDDDASQLRAVERVLRAQEHVDVRFADNGVDAMLQVGLAKPDLIVMDVFMPGLDGIEACRRIKANP
jgi:CheY-like chemotaxis protein